MFKFHLRLLYYVLSVYTAKDASRNKCSRQQFSEIAKLLYAFESFLDTALLGKLKSTKIRPTPITRSQWLSPLLNHSMQPAYIQIKTRPYSSNTQEVIFSVNVSILQSHDHAWYPEIFHARKRFPPMKHQLEAKP